MTQIDLTFLTRNEIRSLSGHDRGLAARNHFKLDELDEQIDAIIVRAPESLDAMTPSFVQGLFARSVTKLGRVRFFLHYEFQVPAHLLADIETGVDRILMNRQIAGQTQHSH